MLCKCEQRGAHIGDEYHIAVLRRRRLADDCGMTRFRKRARKGIAVDMLALYREKYFILFSRAAVGIKPADPPCAVCTRGKCAAADMRHCPKIGCHSMDSS